MGQKFDYNAYSKRLEDLCTRLKQAGLRVDSTRLDCYRKALANFDRVASENRIREWANLENIALLFNDLDESQEIRLNRLNSMLPDDPDEDFPCA
jgi:hypothetical protein